MKKIVICILIAILTLCPLTACKSDANVIKVNEVTHSLFYAPFYLAEALGLFEENDIKIELTNGGGSDASMTAVVSGQADVALLGPETTLYVYHQGRQDYPMIFGQLTKRDGAFLVGRNFEPNFNWSNLENKTIIMGRRGGMPAMTLQYILNQNGYTDGTNITMDYSVSFPLLAPTFASGTGDYVTLFEPTATQVEKEGSGHIVASIGAAGGEVPYTCFVANQSYIKNNKTRLKKFLQCVHDATMYLLSNDNMVVAELLMPYFTGTTAEDIAKALSNYRANDTWKTTPSMTEESFSRLQDIMINAGELSSKLEMNKLVDNSLAEEIKL